MVESIRHENIFGVLYLLLAVITWNWIRHLSCRSRTLLFRRVLLLFVFVVASVFFGLFVLAVVVVPSLIVCFVSSSLQSIRSFHLVTYSLTRRRLCFFLFCSIFILFHILFRTFSPLLLRFLFCLNDRCWSVVASSSFCWLWRIRIFHVCAHRVLHMWCIVTVCQSYCIVWVRSVFNFSTSYFQVGIFKVRYQRKTNETTTKKRSIVVVVAIVAVVVVVAASHCGKNSNQISKCTVSTSQYRPSTTIDRHSHRNWSTTLLTDRLLSFVFPELRKFNARVNG